MAHNIILDNPPIEGHTLIHFGYTLIFTECFKIFLSFGYSIQIIESIQYPNNRNGFHFNWIQYLNNGNSFHLNWIQNPNNG